MTFAGLALRSVRWRWRTVLAAALGVAIAVATVSAALVAGDSLRATLARVVSQRVGRVSTVVAAPERVLPDSLADRWSKDASVPVAPVLMLRGSLSDPDHDGVSVDVSVLGVDARFGPVFGASDEAWRAFTGDVLAVSDAAVSSLGGLPSSLVLRIEKLGVMPRESPLAGADASTIQLFSPHPQRVADSDGGAFAINGSGTAPRNVFVPLDVLQDRLDLDARVNTFLVGPATSPTDWNSLLSRTLTVDALGVTFTDFPGGAIAKTGRVFFEPPLVPALGGRPSLTYFVNALAVRDRSIPYSVLTGVDEVGGAAIPDDALVLSRWAADDLGVRDGDVAEVKFFVPEGVGRLVEHTASLRITRVVEQSDAVAVKPLVPAFPGVSDKAHCRDWQTGMPVELARIRPVDEAYWDRYGTTPKAFVSPATARRLFANRFGDTTALVVPAAIPDRTLDELHLSAADVGVSTLDLVAWSATASEPSTDFAQLFLALGFLVVVAALVLSGLLVSGSVEERAKERELLAALGFERRRILRLLEVEAAAIALTGVLLGLPAGRFAGLMTISALNGAWSGATAGLRLEATVRPVSLLVGALVVGLVGFAWGWRATRAGLTAEWGAGPVDRGTANFAAVVAAVSLGFSFVVEPGLRAALVSMAGLAAAFALTSGLVSPASASARLSLANWSARQLARTPSRSRGLALVVSLGVFLAAVVGANRHRVSNPEDRDAGTGGFGALVSLAAPVVDDPRTAEGRRNLDLDESDVRALAPVPMKVFEADDASCLSLGAAARPSVLGVDSVDFEGRFGIEHWSLLDESGDEVPVIADEATLRWGLKREVGDALTLWDEGGRPRLAKVVAMGPTNVLQGSVIVSRRRFESLYPSTPGFRRFLVEGPPGRIPPELERFSDALADSGVRVEPAAPRLASLLSVENAYLAVFLATGLLATLLGTLGVVVLLAREALRRRSEFALLLALGWSSGQVRLAVARTFVRLVSVGLFGGILSAFLVLAVLAYDRSADVAWGALGAGLLGVTVCVAAAVGFAVRFVLARTSTAALAEES